jgi:hypothetical protein
VVDNLTRPKASYTDLLNIGNNFIQQKNITSELRELSSANIIGTSIISNQLDDIYNQRKNSNKLLLKNLVYHEQSLKSLLRIEQNFIQLREDIENLNSNISKIVNHLELVRFQEELAKKKRVSLHTTSLELEGIEKIKETFPEWGLLQLHIIEEILSKENIHVESFSDSIVELKEAQ